MQSERTRSGANGEPVRLGKRPKSDSNANDEPIRPSKRPRPDTSDESGQPRKKSKSSKAKFGSSKHKEKNKEKNKHRSTAPTPAPAPGLSPDEQAALDARTLKKALRKAARKERKLIERAHRRQVKYLVAKKDAHEEKLKTSWEKAAADEYAVTYAQAGDLTALPPAEIAAFLARESITITDPDAPSASSASPLRPILDFAHLPYTAVTAKMPFSSFEAPTPIQAASWPHTLSGRDVIGVAETGSGKTMAFALPCVEAVVRATRDDDGTVKQRDDERRRKKAEEQVTEPRRRRNWKEQEDEKKVVRALVVSPTRELAMQTHAQMAGLAELVGLECVCLFGGASKDTQRHLLGRADMIVATPGRLRDFMADGTADLSAAAFVVLDEADRMLDKGFEEDIKEILGQTPSPAEGRQTLMFTATWPESVQALAAKLMTRPVKIAIGSAGRETGSGAVELQANARITQRVEVIEPEAKERRLMALIKEHHRAHSRMDRILVFCLYKKEATRIENFLRASGISVASIHGDLRQEQRTRSLEAFKSGTTPVLVATDVAARGLDIPEVKLVINLTFPLTVEDYVHRIGRTGRAGKPGKAITLFTAHDKTHSGSLINVLKAAGQDVPEKLLSFGSTVKKKEHPIYGAHYREPDPTLKVAAKITFDEEE